MLSMQGSSPIFLHADPVDMRKSFEGLSYIVEQHFSAELTCGAYFIFLNKAGNRMKILYWDVDGLALWYKRLEKGVFSRRGVAKTTLSRREFLMLLEGVVPKRINRRYSAI